MPLFIAIVLIVICLPQIIGILAMIFVGAIGAVIKIAPIFILLALVGVIKPNNNKGDK